MPPAPVQQHHFRRACSKFATGITILTVLDRHGRPHGMTANSFTSVSLSPPLVLLCIDLRSRILEHVYDGVAIAINILRENQQEVSDRFSRVAEDRFQGVSWRPGESGAPLLANMLAALECRITQSVEAGDHHIVLAEVLRAEWQDGQPLIYFNSGYHRLENLESREV